MQKLPENIDQLDSFYKEQFEDFSPEVSDSVWESVNNNIGQSSGFSVSTPYLLKVAGLLLGSLAIVAVFTTNNVSKKDVTEEITPTITEEVAPVEETTIEETVLEVENPPVVEETATAVVNNEKTTSKSNTVTEDTTQQKVKNNNETTTDFQFVEELELE